MVCRSTPPPERTLLQKATNVTGRGVWPPHSLFPERRTGSSGAVTLKSMALTGLPSALSKSGALPAAANGSEVPLPNVIRSTAIVISPVIELAVVLTAFHCSITDADHAED